MWQKKIGKVATTFRNQRLVALKLLIYFTVLGPNTKKVIAHPGVPGSGPGFFVASTKRRTSSTGAPLAFAVLTSERKAA